MVSVEQVKLNFGGFDLFKGFSFKVNDRDRIGLTGKNGAGKSTLLKMIAGLLHPTEGNIVVPKDAVIGYLPQTMILNDTQTVYEETKQAFRELLQIEKKINQLNEEMATRTDYETDSYHELIQKSTDLTDHFNMMGGHNYEADIEQTLIGLGFKRIDFSRQTKEFSGGWRMRIELAKLLLRKPDVFLLDEPTNHLDIESIQWLEDFLKNYNGSIILVSHDRAFLDNVTNRTVEISLGRIYDYKANYSKYLELRAERREQQIAAYRNQQKIIQETEDFINRFRYQATKAVQVQSRIKQLEKMERIEIDEEDNSRLNLRFPPPPHSGKIVVEAKEVSKSYGSLEVLKNIDLYIEKGEKIAFVGKNGEGKTTLARIIMNELDYSGKMKIGHNVKIGYFAQNQADLLDDSKTVFETIDDVAVGDVRTKIRDILGSFMFSGEEADKKVKVLSGGERTRLAMVKLMLEPVNFLIMDEPTNHLDMRSKEILKQALNDFNGTVLLVSHDRGFLDGLVNLVYEFRNKNIIQHLGGIYDFIRDRKIESLKELEKKQINAPSKNNKKETNNTSEFSFEEKKEISKNIKKAEKQVEKLERKISELENKVAEMDQQLANPEKADEALFSDYEKIKRTLEQTMYEWEISIEKLDESQTQKTW
ncbi:MAG: ABC-F family ATP-binding cassette domain-containing protein [Prolixibacteraceae bacterium]|jgi:ATP-binding cassette subfamily F protein 3|nr:ABC-F family ATP-binding cassette domain-containing protein [Prolixibacteraceae bacterium]